MKEKLARVEANTKDAATLTRRLDGLAQRTQRVWNIYAGNTAERHAFLAEHRMFELESSRKGEFRLDSPAALQAMNEIDSRNVPPSIFE